MNEKLNADRVTFRLGEKDVGLIGEAMEHEGARNRAEFIRQSVIKNARSIMARARVKAVVSRAGYMVPDFARSKKGKAVVS